MTEFELKLEVPEDRRNKLAAVFGHVPAIRLQAHYFDTAQGDLARSGVVVRVRKEGRDWVQTAKAGSGKTVERLEHNVVLPKPPAGTVPAVDLARHAGTPLEKRIRTALRLHKSGSFPPLQVTFGTDVRRQAVLTRAGHSDIEIALDRGQVVAGEKSESLWELEFELKAGRVADVVDEAKRWCTRHGLWLSTISKSAKGHRLMDGASSASAPRQPPAYPDSAPVALVQAAMVQDCLQQVLSNASEVAAAAEADRHAVHQLRVGLRRLRSVLREVVVPHRPVDPAWEEALAKPFRALGQHRDHGYLVTHQQPALEAAGGPQLRIEDLSGPAPVDTVRSQDLQCTLMELVAYVHQRPRKASGKDPSAQEVVRGRLKKLHRKILREGREFQSLEETAQHRLRKRLKRLRYLVELAVPLFDEAQVKRFLRKLEPLQEALGEYNDGLMAERFYRQLSTTDPRAWFGVGWLSAGHAAHAAACQRGLERLGRTRPFW